MEATGEQEIGAGQLRLFEIHTLPESAPLSSITLWLLMVTTHKTCQSQSSWSILKV